MMDKEEFREADERSAPVALVIFEAVRQEGSHELERPLSSLAWSGLAAGLSMGFSFIAQALLESHLPDAHWTPLISKFGYSIGFLIVILGRQQLFTENTLTPVLQLLQKKTAAVLQQVGRLWFIVLIANIVGALVFSFAISQINIFDPAVYESFNEIARSTVDQNFGATLISGIFAGWLIALIIWLMPFAEVARIWVIIFITYLIGLGEFSHIIAGSVDSLYGVWTGLIPLADFFGRFFLPTLLGNIIGGVALVAAINYAQITYEHKKR